jgi:5-methylcytosine-specific restriction protein B
MLSRLVGTIGSIKMNSSRASKNGVFYEFCRRAAADADRRPHVFIIDEINRGNLSRILGELMLLIEPDHRGERFAIPLTYAKDAADRFWVPETVHLLGMMNTADRSLAMVDYALRRRFCFAQLRPAFDTEEFREFLAGRVDDTVIDRIVEGMTALNARIAKDRNLGRGFEIGHSFFCPADGETALDLAWYEAVIHREIAPLVREYWFDDPDKADELVADLLK